MKAQHILIQGAHANNLNGFSLAIPHHQLIVVTGVSGSGKSSLAFDIIAREGQRRYFETVPSFARQFMGKLNQPAVESIEGLAPVIAIGQKTTGVHSRSTVGTMSDIYDLLRLLFARVGQAPEGVQLSRSLFSFNTDAGRCPQCKGIGDEEKIDLGKLVTDPSKTLREGALAPTLPTGYIMYSQVTIDVLNQVCEAEGFNVDIPWEQLTHVQRDIILYGSEKIKVPFGKHSLESRLKWTGIKAKPREEGYYKGMLNIMSDILRRDRNANILKYVSSVKCSQCHGDRLNKEALSVTVGDENIATISKRTLDEIKDWIDGREWGEVATAITDKISAKTALLSDLGLGYLPLDRSASILSASEAQRIRVTNQLTAPLSDVLYVLDEPSIGLHADENQRMVAQLKKLVEKGNTVIVVEHDLDTILQADWIVDIGPKAGRNGGDLVFNGSLKDFLKQGTHATRSLTHQALMQEGTLHRNSRKKKGTLELKGCTSGNLKNLDVSIQLGQLNVVSGKSGTGTKDFVQNTLQKAAERFVSGESLEGISVTSIENLEEIDRCIFVDQTPIGRTPRSNPATYLGISDSIRDLFAGLPISKELEFTKSRFSFNNKGGRCETCQGAGKTQIGMHFLGVVDILCETCGGDRFNEETLQVTYFEKSIADVYKLSINEALEFFKEESNSALKKIRKGLTTLQSLGLGYLSLGQSSTTLSGGEAQRIKIANQLQKKEKGNSLYILVEPSIGLHNSDLQSLLTMFDHLTAQGNTIVCVEQEEQIIQVSDWHIEFGPIGGELGGHLMHQGAPKSQSKSMNLEIEDRHSQPSSKQHIELFGVSTNSLKNIDVRIPKQQLTVVAGRSGSGKSSLVYDTLFAEASARFSESLSTYNRTFLQQNSTAVLKSSVGLTPSIALRRRLGVVSKRSTVGTLSGIYDRLRLLYSRLAAEEGRLYTAQHFSFNHHLGACLECEGEGVLLQCDLDRIVVNPSLSIHEGALSENKALKYYSDPDGQFMATLALAAREMKVNLNLPWNQLTKDAQQLVLFGSGEREYEVTWEFKTKTRTGIQQLRSTWKGFCHYIDEEFERKRQNKNIDTLLDLMGEVTCPVCKGSRLKPELLQIQFAGKNIHEISKLSILELSNLLRSSSQEDSSKKQAIANAVLPGILEMLNTLTNLGLSYLSLNRTIRSVSGGERQRIMLAGQLASHLHGVTYILDEPTIGLDQSQIRALINLLRTIIDKGNSVVVVEHDHVFIAHADYRIEMGPGAGKMGGEVIYQGPQKDYLAAIPSKISAELKHNRSRIDGNLFGVKGAFLNNLKDIDVEFGSSQLIAITGVSGSGKSTLIRDVLYASSDKMRPAGCREYFGFDQFDAVHFVDQEPFAGTRLTTPASYVGVLDQLKILFAKSEEAKFAGLKRADFGYQGKIGKCPSCGGYGEQKTSLDFLSDVWTHCETCDGQRYNEKVNTIKVNGLSIGQVLKLTAEEALQIFEDSKIKKQLKLLQDLGLGHLSLGQSGTTLSGGEAQRLKLVKHMTSATKGNRLFLLDEPSTGLHRNDILELIRVFERMINEGDTILFIDHNDVLIEVADTVVKLGPGSGNEGGELV